MAIYFFMKIPLNSFETYIDEKILSRGLSYFKNGYVRSVDEITPGEYEAIVDGSEEYSISIQVRKGNIEKYFCDCPYDLGPVCKHVAAVIFHLQQDAVIIIQQDEKKTVTKPKTKSEKVVVSEILSKLSHADLKEFVEGQSKENAVFRQAFLSRFGTLVEEESLDFYRKQLKGIIRSVVGRNDFIEWGDAPKIAKPTSNLLALAQKHFDAGNFQGSVFICCAVLEELTGVIGYADDSRGTLGDNIDTAFELLYEVSSVGLSETIRNSLFEYCIDTFKKGIFSGWDWHIGMLEIASNIIENDEQADIIITHLDSLNNSRYESEEAQILKLNILKNRGRSQEADALIQKNITNPSIREKQINDFMSAKQYDKAISLAKYGIEYDSKDRPGLVHRWEEYLLQIAVLQNDVERIIHYARLLFLSNTYGRDPYYALMKKHVDTTKWGAFLELIIKDIKQKNKWYFVDEVAYIYIQEKWWEKLLALICDNNPRLETVSAYEQYLIKDYPNEVADLYAKLIPDYLEANTSREHYKTACRYLRRMIKCGASDKVAELKDYFIKKYPRRKALMEELAFV